MTWVSLSIHPTAAALSELEKWARENGAQIHSVIRPEDRNPSPRGRPRRSPDVPAVETMRAKGRSWRAISRATGISERTLRRMVARHNVGGTK